VNSSYLHFRVYHNTLVFLCLSIFAGCSTLLEYSSEKPLNWEQTRAQREKISSWKLVGKLGVQTEDNGGSVDLFWTQKGENYKIRLIAPFGQGTTLINGNARGVHIKTSEGERYTNNPDELFTEQFGINLPVHNLHSWLRGLAVRGRPVEKQRWDENGQLYKLVQDGWNVEMSRYRKVQQQILPHQFYLDRDDRPELGIRPVIRNIRLSLAGAGHASFFAVITGSCRIKAPLKN